MTTDALRELCLELAALTPFNAVDQLVFDRAEAAIETLVAENAELVAAQVSAVLREGKALERAESAESRLAAAEKDARRIDYLADTRQSVAEVMLPKEIAVNHVDSLRDAIDSAMSLYPLPIAALGAGRDG